MFKKNVLALLSVLVICSSLTGCNTARGFGEDISASGRAIQSGISR